MSETPNPSKPAASGKGPARRGGLVLPPRGQALARLQDLEEESELAALTTRGLAEDLPSTEGSSAVNTASSNAVQPDSQASESPMLSTKFMATDLQGGQTYQPSVTTAPKLAASSDYQSPIRAVREPTTRITVDMPDSLHQKISVLSAQTRRSIKDLVIEALAATYFGTTADPQ